MKFSESVSAYYSNYAEFSGRTSRSGYWWVVLWSLFLTVPLFLAFVYLGAFGVAVYWIYVLAHIIPGIAIGIRRLHDTDKSGWFLLVAFIPIVGSLILLVLLLQPSTHGTNDWGAAVD